MQKQLNFSFSFDNYNYSLLGIVTQGHNNSTSIGLLQISPVNGLPVGQIALSGLWHNDCISLSYQHRIACKTQVASQYVIFNQ